MFENFKKNLNELQMKFPNFEKDRKDIQALSEMIQKETSLCRRRGKLFSSLGTIGISTCVGVSIAVVSLLVVGTGGAVLGVALASGVLTGLICSVLTFLARKKNKFLLMQLEELGNKVSELKSKMESLYCLWRDSITFFEDMVRHQKTLYTSLQSFNITDPACSQNAREIEMRPLLDECQRFSELRSRVENPQDM